MQKGILGGRTMCRMRLLPRMATRKMFTCIRCAPVGVDFRHHRPPQVEMRSLPLIKGARKMYAKGSQGQYERIIPIAREQS